MIKGTGFFGGWGAKVMKREVCDRVWMGGMVVLDFRGRCIKL